MKHTRIFLTTAASILLLSTVIFVQDPGWPRLLSGIGIQTDRLTFINAKGASSMKGIFFLSLKLAAPVALSVLFLATFTSTQNNN